MSAKRYTSALFLFFYLSALIPLSLLFELQLNAMSNLTKNDPYPLFSAAYPYDFLAQNEKIYNFMFRAQEYEETRFRLSFSPFRQAAKCATDIHKLQTPIGNLPQGCGMNFSALFFDPAIGIPLANELGLDTTAFTFTCTPGQTLTDCLELIRSPSYQDPACAFGYVSSYILYRKYGVRFEADFLVIDTCFDGVGIRFRGGVADVRQTVTTFLDNTCTSSCINGCDNGTVACNPYSSTCVNFMIDNIIKQKNLIAQSLGYELCSTYHKLGPEDLRLSLFWRHLYDINPDDVIDFPRAVIIPFVEAGVSIPMTKHLDPRYIFGVPLGNGHVGAGAWGGVLVNFPDTVEIGFQGGFTHFFREKYCNYPLTTYEFEQLIYPYRADVYIKPGTSWHAAVSLYAWHFLENLSFWGEYVLVSHENDDIKLCRSLLPPNSIFNPDTTASTATLQQAECLGIKTRRGYLIDKAECWTKWESHMFNFGFTYDISPYAQLGLLWQTSFRQRNAYRSSTLLGSIMMTY